MQLQDLAFPNISLNVSRNDIKRASQLYSLELFGKSLNLISMINTNYAAYLALNNFSKTQTVSFKARGIFNKAIEKIIEVNDKQITTYVFGESDKRVLLCHGWNGQASDFYRLIPLLVANGYQVVAFDGPGHGQSSGQHTDIFEFIEVIEEISKFYGPFYSCIGHSMGGAAIALASDMSLVFNPKKIITIGSPNKFKVILDNYTRFLGLNMPVKIAMQELIEKVTGLKVKALSISSSLDSKSVSALIIHDINDDMVPYSRALEIIDDHPEAQLLLTSGLGHVKVLRDSKVIENIVTFLSEY